ncbi:MFS transporter [Pseudomonas sp. CC120222-01a]|uniref:MFS transporter n=1 Tax=Pseudomonas sp. CC120222-01a TaxID=1378075 RepID=UPI000D877F9E|nr:MFS transporter [Pseudomonas sp. CC120222-01a]PVZ42515.1 putative MFS family arabinose efflux permease [Pseudomonas sp. CC120222-01a]
MNVKQTAGAGQALLLLLGSCLPVLGGVLVAPVLPSMQAHFAATPGASVLVPIALTVPALMIALTAPLAGWLADRIGRRKLLLVCMALYSCFGLMPLWLDSLSWIVASRAGIGLAEAAILTCCTALIGDYFESDRRIRLFALQMVATSLSAAIFMGVGGALGEGSWRTPFTVYVVGILCLPFMARMLWEPSSPTQEVVHSEPGVFPWRALTPLYGLSLFAGVSLFIVPVQAGYLLQFLHIDSPQQIGLTMGANQIGVLVGALSFRLIAKLPGRVLLALGFLGAGVGGALMGWSNSHSLVVGAVLINGLGIGLLLPALVTQVMHQVEFSQRGRASGLFAAAVFAGEFASPLFVLALTAGVSTALPQALILVGITQVALAPITLLMIRAPQRIQVAEAQ